MKTSKFLSSLTTTFGTLLILLLISCERPGVDPLGPSTSKLRQAASNETDLPILEVIVEDYESKKSTIEKRPKHSKDFSTDDADPGECSGTEYLYVGGLSLQ